MTTYFYISVAVLAALLFIPVSKLIWVMSVRRLERKWSRPLTDAERGGQQQRARVIAMLLTLPFSWLFNLQLIGAPSHG